MKLQNSQKYTPLPIILTTDNVLYYIPLSLWLLHSVEEIETKIALWQDPNYFAQLLAYQESLCEHLHVDVEM